MLMLLRFVFVPIVINDAFLSMFSILPMAAAIVCN